MAETTAAAYPDLLAPARRLGRRLAAQLEAERDRWALWIPVGFASGVGFYFAWDREPPTWLGAACLGLAALAGLLVRRRPGPTFAALTLAALALAVVAAGFAGAQLRSALVAAPVLEKRLGPVGLSGQVVAVERRSKGWRLTLRQPRVPALDPARTPEKIRVTVFADIGAVRPGDWVRLRAVLRPPPEPVAPGAFDFARPAYFKGLGGVGYAFGGVSPLAPEGIAGRSPGAAEIVWPGLSRLWWTRLRQAIAERVLAVLPGPPGAVAAALMTGESSGT